MWHLLIHNPTEEGNDPVLFHAKLKLLNGQQITEGLYLIETPKTIEALKEYLRTECQFRGPILLIPTADATPV